MNVTSYIATTKNNVLIDTDTIMSDNFSSILLKNIGTDAVTINDNIPIAPGEALSWDNQPYVVIGENIGVRFAGAVGMDKKLLVVRTYFKEGK